MAQNNINGVSIGSINTPDGPMPVLVNSSDKPLIGFTVQRTTTTGRDPVFTVVDLNSLVRGKPIQPGEERPLGLANVIRVGRPDGSSTGEEETLGYALMAALFGDGTFYGPDSVFLDFSRRISMTRSLARDAQYAREDKYTILAQHKEAFADPRTILKAMRTPSVDFRALELRSTMAGIILSIRDRKGEREADAALAKIASLPDVTRGEQQ